jgi:hypothetical protein
VDTKQVAYSQVNLLGHRPFLIQMVFFSLYLGFSDGTLIDDYDGTWIWDAPNSYSIPTCANNYNVCRLNGKYHEFEVEERLPTFNMVGGNVHGCGLLLNPNDKLSIFFTLNGQLMGEFYAGKIGKKNWEEMAKEIGFYCRKFLILILIFKYFDFHYNVLILINFFRPANSNSYFVGSSLPNYPLF